MTVHKLTSQVISLQRKDVLVGRPKSLDGLKIAFLIVKCDFFLRTSLLLLKEGKENKTARQVGKAKTKAVMVMVVVVMKMMIF